MNELEFKQHLRDLAHGRHHPEEHDWGKNPASARASKVKPRSAARKTAAKKRTHSK